MIKRAGLFGAAVLEAAAWPTALGQPPLRNIYVVTQAYCLKPQVAPNGKCHRPGRAVARHTRGPASRHAVGLDGRVAAKRAPEPRLEEAAEPESRRGHE